MAMKMFLRESVHRYFDEWARAAVTPMLQRRKAVDNIYNNLNFANVKPTTLINISNIRYDFHILLV